MPMTEIDHLWFSAHPDRQYRLRRETPAETAGWQVPPQAGYAAWCIIRRSDSVSVSYGLPEGETWDDYDEELEPFFDHLNEDAA